MAFGVARLLADLQELGHQGAEYVKAGDGTEFAVLRGYTVALGRFQGQLIDLALPAPPNYPQGVGSAIHVQATPQLLPDGNIPNKRNVTASCLGPAWRYWSHSFGWTGERSTRQLLAQVNRIFHDA